MAIDQKSRPDQRSGSAGPPIAEFAVQVVDAAGQSVAGAKVTPWALRSAHGHGLWTDGDKWSGCEPTPAATDAAGVAAIRYPVFRHLAEQVRTITVSVMIDHPAFAVAGEVHIDVPLETSDPYRIELAPGITVELCPLIDGKPIDLSDVFALWSDNRSYHPGTAPAQLPGGLLRIAAMPAGEQSALVAKLDGERATHLSRIVDFTLTLGQTQRVDVPLCPGLRVLGRLSENVPRPVRQGVVKGRTLAPPGGGYDRVEWETWAPIAADGTFVIDPWPAGERMQLIALCKGFIACSGTTPAGADNRFESGNDPFQRPQVFCVDDGRPIMVPMTPLARCAVRVVDADDEPLAGVKVHSWPNVGWWNGGSQVYCEPLVRTEQLLRERDIWALMRRSQPELDPFEGISGADGRAILELPPGRQDLAASSDDYELPVFLGNRYVEVDMADGKTTEVTLCLERRGSEMLGEWDMLAGIVFGCSTRAGRRMCALPRVSERMEEFARRFRRAAGKRRDPQLLAEAYGLVAETLAAAGEPDEAERWRQKAAAKLAKIVGPAGEPQDAAR